MAEYMIQDTTLDAIADAINAKTGGASAMTPAQMAEAIGSIQTGGGSPWELIADYTSDAASSKVVCDIPTDYQNSKVYKVLFLGVTGSDYPYYGINNNFAPYAGRVSNINCVLYVTKIGPQSAGENVTGLVMASPATNYPTARSVAPFESVSIRSYYTDDRISAGFNVKVWRLIE